MNGNIASIQVPTLTSERVPAVFLPVFCISISLHYARLVLYNERYKSNISSLNFTNIFTLITDRLLLFVGKMECGQEY